MVRLLCFFSAQRRPLALFFSFKFSSPATHVIAAFSVIDITTPVVLRATSEQKCFSASQMRIGKGEGGEVVASGKIVGTDGEGYRERQLVSWKGVGGQFPWFTNDQCSLSG